MHYFYTKPGNRIGNGGTNDGDITTIIRANFTSTSLLSDIANYAILRGWTAYGADEAYWDTAVAFNLYPCIEFNGKEFITIHE